MCVRTFMPIYLDKLVTWWLRFNDCGRVVLVVVEVVVMIVELVVVLGERLACYYIVVYRGLLS